MKKTGITIADIEKLLGKPSKKTVEFDPETGGFTTSLTYPIRKSSGKKK